MKLSFGPWRKEPLKKPVPPEKVKPGQHEFDRVAAHYDMLMSHVPYRGWVNYVEKLMVLGNVKARRVLDLACGTGKVGSEMLRRGYEAVGADLSEQMACFCSRQQPPLPAMVMDAARMGLQPESLDLVVCLYDSLNYVLEPAGLQECFRRVREALRPGGALIFDMNTPRALRIGLFTQQNLSPLSALQYRWESQWDPRSRLCRVEMWFRWHGGAQVDEFHETHYQRAYEEAEVRGWLEQAGFEKVESFHAYTTRPVDSRSDRMFFLALRSGVS